MGKILKWIGIVLGVLVLVVVVAAGVIFIRGQMIYKQTFQTPEVAVTVPTDAASLERGKHLMTVLVDCVGHAKVKPSQQVLACADGADVLMKLNWSHWGAQALATGSEAINDCTPTCVGGTFHKFPVITVLWRVRPRPHHSGQMMFTRATIIYTGTIPAGFHRTRTIPLFG